MEKSMKSDVEKTIKTQLSDIEKSMTNIESKLMKQDNKISTIEAEADRLGSDDKATNDGLEQCESDIVVIHDAVDAIKNKISTLDTEAICAEINDRARRQNNNVKETQNENCFNKAVSSIVDDFGEHKLVLLGDYNLPNVSWMTGGVLGVQFNGPLSTALRSAAVAVCSCFTFSDLTDIFPIHHSKNYNLDLVFASRSCLSNVDVSDTLIATDQHHIPAMFSLTQNSNHAPSPCSKFIDKKFFKVDYSRISTVLDQVDWDLVVSGANPECVVKSLQQRQQTSPGSIALIASLYIC
ncbi:hypothetical protein QAD02_017324 [Eretmocerus hayati]|uniref:Uncharacterized protein n=1 Tax=Eretmocerus hayati TaxID=131215 RepID=A0ACC2PDZ5_9HYME|nr:hypothetical protein QAD02_017324 [Eretmocerus hayati]